jgi:hypothetical protein
MLPIEEASKKLSHHFGGEFREILATITKSKKKRAAVLESSVVQVFQKCGVD